MLSNAQPPLGAGRHQPALVAHQLRVSRLAAEEAGVQLGVGGPGVRLGVRLGVWLGPILGVGVCVAHADSPLCDGDMMGGERRKAQLRPELTAS